MKAKMWLCLSALLAVGMAVTPAAAQEPFKNLVGDYKVADVQKGDSLEVPFILWGGDVATFMANGGLTTTPQSTFGKSGLKLTLKPGDDFPAQVKDYMEGKSPFLRGTMSMLCQASEVIGSDERTKPVVFLQLTWSNGDHLVDRSNSKDLGALKGKTIALQRGGPHVGMLHDCLITANLKWTDIKIVWTDDVTGEKGPAELFRKEPKIDACFAITPDMVALTGDEKAEGKVVGTGAEGTVRGARVLVSTRAMNGSIADVYACRSDFFKANKELVKKIAVGYLKESEHLASVKEQAGAKNTAAIREYKDILKLTMDIFNMGAEKGKEPLPGDADTDGLISDAEFAFLNGNVYFFKAEKWGANFTEKQKAGLDAAIAVNSISKAIPFTDAGWDFTALKTAGMLAKEIPTDLTNPPQRTINQKEIEKFLAKPSESNTIASFEINFGVDEEKFDEDKYREAFEKAIKSAAVFRNAVVAVRGHADLAKLLGDFVKASIEKGHLRREGTTGAYKYFAKDNSPFDLNDTPKVVKAIHEWDFSGSSENPKRTLEALEELSSARAKTVQNTVVDYAKKYNMTLDKNQIQAVGVGVQEPTEPTPRTKEAMAKNRRGEFKIYKLPAETAEGGGF